MKVHITCHRKGCLMETMHYGSCFIEKNQLPSPNPTKEYDFHKVMFRRRVHLTRLIHCISVNAQSYLSMYPPQSYLSMYPPQSYLSMYL